ncbi:replicative helicase loader/inhibitor [Bacillus sp. 1P02SD]|uniref:replicative helicase loader/inhibitor n=1 Tax=Bacillus sp. 1P02SD TaxID=3132264 RepID=UPI0039A23493
MNRAEVIQLFKYIKMSYENFEVSTDKVDFWQGIFKDQDFTTVMKKLEKHVRSNKFAPTISELYEENIESKVNHEHLSFMRNLRGEDFYRNNHEL